MRVTEIRELSVPLEGNISNAVVNFAEHTVSLVAVLTDVVRDGRQVIGLAFNSIGRFAQGGIIRDRVIPRMMAAGTDALLDAEGSGFDPAKVLATAMRNEKPGGHGDRAGAVGALELAFWDLNAKLRGEPAWVTIARHFGTTPQEAMPVYAAGGYYYGTGGAGQLRDELLRYRDMGFDAYKMKIGGASLADDVRRIEEALTVAGDGSRLAVDANGRFGFDEAIAYADAIRPFGLRWYEEIGDPLDYDLNRRVAECYDGPIATGENLFSAVDTRNLLRHGGMRPGRDVFQMDAGISYGLVEYGRMIALMEEHGFDRRFAFPHGGHMINLHIVVGMGLGGCEAYPGVFQPFGGYAAECRLVGSRVVPGASPGFGLEAKDDLRPAIAHLLN
ncbi:mandelate racemase [Roseomonas sp. KE2513]|nr:mandelate racemase [Roseomonas sp. KE2513]